MTETDGLILAGGRASRLGGIDKGWQLFKGRALVEHSMQQLSACSGLIISANRNLAAYRKLGAQVVSDFRDDYQGPLSGIESAMLQSHAAWLYVMPCDVLGVPADWQEKLFLQAKRTESPWVGTRDGERLQPLLGYWSRALLPALSSYLDDGGRRVMDFVQPYQQHALVLPATVHLLNLNTAEAINAAEQA